jgi:hypothetical protein
MSKRAPTKEAFEKLLNWLDPDREKAGERYELIRVRLIRIFAGRGCHESEDLADETMNVVVSRIDWLIENYQGDPALYFYGVAKNIFHEHYKKKPPPPLPPPPDTTIIEGKCGCLEECLKQELARADQRLLLLYHAKQKREKIVLRQQLASESGITINALRIRVHHLHARLKLCIEQCLEQLLSQ